MKKIKLMITLLATLTTSSLSALTLIIEDFDNFVDTSSLHNAVFSFGSAAQAGRPSLAEGLGVGDSNAACFAFQARSRPLSEMSPGEISASLAPELASAAVID